MAPRRVKLPPAIQEKIATFPEYSYGSHRVTLILDDGSEVLEVYVAGDDEVVRVGSTEDVSLDVSRVVDVRSEV
jgi:hypothetical protein